MRTQHRNKTEEEEWEEYIECNATHDAELEIFLRYEMVPPVPITVNIPIRDIRDFCFKADPRRGVCVARDLEPRPGKTKRFYTPNRYFLDLQAQILNAVAAAARDFLTAKRAEAKARYRVKYEDERKRVEGSKFGAGPRNASVEVGTNSTSKKT